MKNWKTTLGGILLALGSILPTLPIPEEYKWLAQVLTAVGGVLLGASAKDFNVHSTYEEIGRSTYK